MASFKHSSPQAEAFAQAVQLVHAREPGANNDGVERGGFVGTLKRLMGFPAEIIADPIPRGIAACELAPECLVSGYGCGERANRNRRNDYKPARKAASASLVAAGASC